uniref:Chemokine interleukin-8-like domain-containing protein n=1 Tax=Denticeps clupeoides TaxID=299321 RepID=A0AAY4CC57_9TELE
FSGARFAQKSLLLEMISIVITFTRNLLVSDSSGPSECCFDFYTKRIPVIALHGVLYFRTSCRFCANSASFWIYFRLKTVKDVELCVNPADQSIQDLMENSIYQTPLSRAPYNQ